MASIRIGKISFLILSLLVLISLTSPVFIQPVSAQNEPLSEEALRGQFTTVLQNLDTDRIKGHVQFFSNVSSRVTGYPGFFESVDYVVSKFREYGIQPYGDDGTYFENYEVTVPIDHGATITLGDGAIINGHNIWPNLVNPCPYSSPEAGDKLIYVGKGSFDDLESINLTDRFVLMEFDSRWFFRLAAMFGAKGIIYVGSDDATRMEAIQKLYACPVNLPRIYLSFEDGYQLRELCRGASDGEIAIRISSFMEWQKILVPNVLGFIRGTGISNETAVISAYLDSWSIVPALAPGATDSLGISVLLEVARFLAQNHPRRSVILLGVSGHWEGLWGAREFVDRHFDDIGESITFFAGMDLATGSGQLGIADLGSSYAYRNIEILNGRYSWLVARFFQNYLTVMQSETLLGEHYGEMFVDQILNTYPPWIRGSLPVEFMGATMFDSEPYVSACYGGGFTYRTVNDARYYMKTPVDTFERVRWEYLWPQVQFIMTSLWGLLNEPTIQLTQTPSRMEATGEWGYCNLRIQVVQYNFTTAYWDAFDARHHPAESKDTIVHIATSVTTTAGTGAVTPILGVGVFGTPTLGSTGYLDVIAIPDEDGEVLVKGVKPYSGGVADAFVVNRTNGRLEWAMDLGAYQAPSATGARFFSITTTETFKMVSVFRCGSIMMYSLFNPSDLNMIPSVLIYNHIAHGNLIWQSTLASFYGDLMIFVQTGMPVEILITRGTRFPLGLLLNSTSDKAIGYGYTVAPGETLVLTYTPMIYARNLYWLNDGRVQTAYSYNTYNPNIIVFHGLAKDYLDKSERDLAEGKIGAAYGDAYASWAYEQQAYLATMDLVWQVIYTTVFFSIALIPFALLVERLAFGFEGVKRISVSLVVFAAFMVVLGIFHPGFHLATNASIAIMAFGMMAIMIPSLAFIAGEASATAKSLREQLTGLHVAEISRASAILQAFSTGVQNMKKRRFRTILTLVSLTLIVFAMVTFTSLASIPRSMIDVTATVPAYQGIMLRKVSWLPIPEEMYYQVGVMTEQDSIVAARGWLFPPTPPRGLASFAFSPSLLTKIGGVLFLTPDEAEVTRVNDTVIRGRWLLPEDTYVCLISEGASDNLTKELGRPIREGSTLNFLGLDLKVIGIFDGKALWSGTTGIRDLDGESITPVIPIAMREGGVPAHFEGDRIMIMPFRLCLLLRERTQIESAAIKPIGNASGITDLAIALSLRMQTNIFYSYQSNQTKVVRYRAWFSAEGMTNLIIPAIIGGFTVLNMMLGAVHERMREIAIYMAVGLSPLHVGGLFMAESVVHAMLSAILGYMSGIIGCWVFGTLNLYPPGFFPNYSSYFVLYVVGASAGVTVASSLYPSLRASRTVTPSLERRWKIPKPTGREWEIALPFVATENEVYGIFAFINEYLQTHAVEGVGLFATFGDVSLEEKKVLDRDNKVLSASVRLAPFDVGITQRLTITASAPEGGRYSIVLYLTCLTGLLSDWINSNRPFIDNMRKQLLIWRALPPSQKEIYISKVGLVLGRKPKSEGG